MYKLLNLQILKLNGYHMILGDRWLFGYFPKIIFDYFFPVVLKHFLPTSNVLFCYIWTSTLLAAVYLIT